MCVYAQFLHLNMDSTTLTWGISPRGCLFPFRQDVYAGNILNIFRKVVGRTVNFGGHTIFRENNVYCFKDFMQNSLLFIGVWMCPVY